MDLDDSIETPTDSKQPCIDEVGNFIDPNTFHPDSIPREFDYLIVVVNFKLLENNLYKKFSFCSHCAFVNL